MGIQNIETLKYTDNYLTEAELAPRMAISEDLIKLLQEGKAKIVAKREGKPVNGRRMFEIDVELID